MNIPQIQLDESKHSNQKTGRFSQKDNGRSFEEKGVYEKGRRVCQDVGSFSPKETNFGKKRPNNKNWKENAWKRNVIRSVWQYIGYESIIITTLDDDTVQAEIKKILRESVNPGMEFTLTIES